MDTAGIMTRFGNRVALSNYSGTGANPAGAAGTAPLIAAMKGGF
jgi:hypothetical protein